MVLLPLLLCSAWPAAGQLEQIQTCGSVPYYPSDYRCYDDHALCPNLDGHPTLPCGGACYSPDMYQCSEEGQLSLLPTANAGSTPFKLEVHSSNSALNSKPVKVCNLQFQTGADAHTCVYCYNAPPMYVCESYHNETVLLPSGYMSVDVPGGQAWFVEPDTGKLKTTAAGKAGGSGREHAGKNVTIYQEGYFSFSGSSHWLACKEPGLGQLFSIFAPIGNNTNRGECEKVKLVVVSTTDPKEGAYAYT
ncbi:carbohydrate-binding module family 52 protein [Canariomyces notabilis]|uniref:Carbohydrate-binding module family 52 protein n=1 Tax=Canariomyces notabilis TaxID=2074819 RepID=A0AAN6QK27_9PEZI|nr:carbohydrate-binding module family 52 protein [Canariomyces arenarius]